MHKDTTKRALLLCIIGNKMSKGINFKDNIARGAAVVGFPYSNLKDIELKETIGILER